MGWRRDTKYNHGCWIQNFSMVQCIEFATCNGKNKNTFSYPVVSVFEYFLFFWLRKWKMLSAWRAAKISGHCLNPVFVFAVNDENWLTETHPYRGLVIECIFSMVMFIGLQFFKYKEKEKFPYFPFPLYHIIYGLNIIYLLCLEFYVHKSLICWQNGMESTSSIYYAWNLTFMDLSSFWKMENAFPSEKHTKSMNIIYYLSLLFKPKFNFFILPILFGIIWYFMMP